jgi:hypothetical protein
MTIKPIKVKRTTGNYNANCYNLKVNEKRNPGKDWEVYDASRNMEQAVGMVTSLEPGVGIICQAPDGDKTFPYYIYKNRKLERKRWAQYKQGVRWE